MGKVNVSKVLRGYLFLLLCAGSLQAAEMESGDRTPYRIELRMAVDTHRRPQADMANLLADALGQRVDATLSPFWDLKISVPRGSGRYRLLSQLDTRAARFERKGDATGWQDPEGGQSARGKRPDKRMLLAVAVLPTGYRMRCREWDNYVRRWGPVRQRTVAQRSLLVENCFQLLRDVFAPLAVVHLLSEDVGQAHSDKLVRLQFKGSQLASEPIEQLFMHAGDLYQPLLRRTDRSGDLRSIAEIPWTYLALRRSPPEGPPAKGVPPKGAQPEEGQAEKGKAEKSKAEKSKAEKRKAEKKASAEVQPAKARPEQGRPEQGQSFDSGPAERNWQAVIASGLRHPFGSRLRGRSELLALALHKAQASSRVRFYARHNRAQALSGYQVFQQQASAKAASRLLGFTNSRGMIQVGQDLGPIVMLLLRSDGRLLAKVPVVPGVAALVEVPVADDMARLQAQARLVEIREQLVDLVARRNILLARVRDGLDQGHLDQARLLIQDLDALPGRAQMNQILSTAESQSGNRSKDPRIQARIAKLFANTRALLGRSLDARPVRDLENAVNTAGRKTAPTPP